MEKKFVGFRTFNKFKKDQDEFNAKTFLSLDANGKAKPEQLPDNLVNVMEIHADFSDPDNPKFYKDVDGEKSSEEIIGRKKMIYIDLDSNKKYIWTGRYFTLLADKVSQAQQVTYDIEGNQIDTFYAKKSDMDNLGGSPIPKATNYKFGTVKIGENLSIDENGTVSFSKTNIINALGYEPFDENDMVEIRDEDVDEMFPD